MAPAKNLLLWLDVAEDVLAEAPETRFVLVGDGELEGELRRRVEARGFSDQILFPGPMTYDALAGAYAAADILLLTSDNEGFGRVLLEAAEAGVPAVATRCSGPMDVIRDGVSGYLLDLGDRRGLGAAVLRLLRDPALRARMGMAARAAAGQDFGRENLTQRLIEHWTAP
jgi:phosphatidylinositol alpha 1,6-mannosyltransferase